MTLQMAWLEEGARSTFMLPEECPADAEKGAWHVSPTQHLVECILVVSLSLLTIFFCSRRFRAHLKLHAAVERGRSAAGLSPLGVPPLTWRVRVLDFLCLALLTLSALTVVWHKVHGDKLAFLLQPCHVLHALLLVILLHPRGSARGGLLLAVYCHQLPAPFLGTVAADLSCYTQRFEALNWGVQHVMLLLVPLHLLHSRRFGRLHSGPHLFALSFAALSLWHYAVLLPGSIITGTNINYILCPPAGQAMLLALGRWYRPPMTLFCAVLAWIMRYGLVTAFLRMCCKERCNLEAVTPMQGKLKAEGEQEKETDAAQSLPATSGLSAEQGHELRQRQRTS